MVGMFPTHLDLHTSELRQLNLDPPALTRNAECHRGKLDKHVSCHPVVIVLERCSTDPNPCGESLTQQFRQGFMQGFTILMLDSPPYVILTPIIYININTHTHTNTPLHSWGLQFKFTQGIQSIINQFCLSKYQQTESTLHPKS